MRGVVDPALNSVEANTCPPTSSEVLDPAPLDRLLLSCSTDITVQPVLLFLFLYQDWKRSS
jgi:hypothetical protein